MVCQVPHLDDDDEKAWVFDTVSKKHHIHRIFTAMNGSVIASETAGASGKKRKAAAVPKAKAKKAPKRAAKANTSAEPDVSLPPEPELATTVVDCEYGVRNKLWIDDLMACAVHTVKSLHAQFGEFLDTAQLDRAKASIIRLGLRSAFVGEVHVATAKFTKKYCKWSLVRPALQSHGVHLVTQARKNIHAAQTRPCTCTP